MRAKVPIKLIKPSQLTVMFEVQREAVSSWVKLVCIPEWLAPKQTVCALWCMWTGSISTTAA